MEDTGISFSWGYVGAVVIGAFIGLLFAEVIGKMGKAVWAARIETKRRKLSAEIQRGNLILLKDKLNSK
jgi:hypothetical protein